MRIGVDARLLARPLTGIGRYTHEMVNALLRANADLVLYAPGPLIHPLHLGTGRYKERITVMQGGARRFLWGQLVLPLQVRRDRPDVFWGPAHRLPLGLPREIFGCLTIHDLVWRFAGNTMAPASRLVERVLMPPALRRADAIVAVSGHTKMDITRTFPKLKAPITRVYPGVSPRPSGHPPEYLTKWGITRPYMLFVGTLEPRKNLGRLLQAYATLPSEVMQQADLVVAGGRGWGDVDLEKTVASLGLQGKVHLTGYVDERELSTLYENALFLTMPSLYEGFGLPLVEAMRYGLPSLTANLSSMPEVAHGASVLVDPLNVDAIADGLARLISSSELRAQLSEAAAGNVARFDWDKAAQELLGLFAHRKPTSRDGL
ncbi:glycosyltransferase family 4 protein [Mesorhizobium sp. A556]